MFTDKQKDYLECVTEGDRDNYTRATRHLYRKTMARRVMRSLIGVDVAYYHRFNTHLQTLQVLNRLMDVRKDDTAFSEVFLDELEHPFIDMMLCDMVTDATRLDVVKKSRIGEPIDYYAIRELIQIVRREHETVTRLILENKKE